MNYHSDLKFLWVGLFILSFALFGCDGGGGGGGGTLDPNRIGAVSGCSLLDYSDPVTSEYILPYQVGMSFRVSQGNCGTSTHQPICNAGGFPCGDLRYGIDFFMPIGIVVLAARGGTVVQLEDQFSNSTSLAGQENFVIVEHSDGTFARYIHFSPSSLMINLGDVVSQGDPIGLSGDSGFTGVNNPHLHIDVVQEDSSTCTERQTTVDANGGNIVVSGCKTIPITFRNAQPLDAPLLRNRTYTALPF